MQMKRFIPLLAVLAMATAGCTTESNFPEATGKGIVRAINAIPGSPAIVFLVEESARESVDYKSASAAGTAARWDDLSYTFNFEVLFPSEARRRRVASRNLQVVANRDYIFALTGAVENPTITVFEDDERIWDGSETVFEVRFAHLAESLGAVDIYFQADGVAPAAGEEAATLSNGGINSGTELPEGEYVVTITTAGDPSDILYESLVENVDSSSSLVVALFDGDENDLHPIVVRGLRDPGTVFSFAERNTPPEVRFIQASIDLPLADVYEDETLANLLAEDQAFGDVSAYLQIPIGDKNITYTPADDVGSTLFESPYVASAGTRGDFFAIGQSGSYEGLPLFAERRSVSTEARFRLVNASVNHDRVDVYVVPTGESIDNTFPATSEPLNFATSSPSLGFVAGDYDVYVTPRDEKTVLDGPFPASVALGDVVNLMILDTVDPATAELRLIQ